MSNIYFNSLAGMMAASFGLKNVSNNVSNMQSPGYKGSNVFFQSIGGGGNLNDNLGGNIGNGVSVGDSNINFRQGNLESTGISTHLAIDGEGFFIVQMKSGEYLYTRDGEFDFDKDGYLIDTHTKGYVMGYDKAGHLTKITKNGPETYPGKATSEVLLSGNIYYEEIIKNNPNNNDDSTDKSKYKKITFTVDIYDDKGTLHHLDLTFEVDETEPSPNKINLLKVEENGGVLYQFDGLGTPDYSIEFSMGGYPSENHSFDLDLTSLNQTIRFDFGKEKDGASKYVMFQNHSGNNTQINVNYQDGYALGNLYGTKFDENGQIEYLYTNDQSSKGIHVALARFDDPNATLTSTDNNAFRARTNEGRHIGKANENALGGLVAGKIELSNVDSTNEFANIVILQRMFQACSQMMEIDKQLLEELYKK